VLASKRSRAGIKSASVVIIAVNGSSNAYAIRTRGGIALISASKRQGGKNTTGGIVARVDRARIVVIANLGCYSTPSCRVATTKETLVSRTRRGNIDVLTPNLRGYQNGTQILCAGIVVGAVCYIRSSAARLATSLTNITPIIVRASNFN
jgi:hypothetical protein